jgi:hypothetical protein
MAQEAYIVGVAAGLGVRLPTGPLPCARNVDVDDLDETVVTVREDLGARD